ncbi:hypothetical protein [Nonomuraea sp. NPDC005650]
MIIGELDAELASNAAEFRVGETCAYLEAVEVFETLCCACTKGSTV